MTTLFEVRGLSVGYEHPILNDISFQAEAGEIFGILGRNGCGKTTLLRGITGGVRTFGGRVLANGIDCTKLSPKKRAAQMALLPQRTEILRGITVRELLEMGRYPYGSLFWKSGREDERRIREAAQTLGAADLLAEDCAKLSQGQLQLVLLTRLLVQDAPVMLLDEPDAALDFYNREQLFAALAQLVKSRGKTAVVVLHDPELALRRCDRILILKNGAVAASLHPAAAAEEETEEALRLLYPGVKVRRDPFSDKLRCYP